MNIPSVELNSSRKIPQIGLGLWKNVLPHAFYGAINAGLAAGYRHFDTAQIYGNETMLGKALRLSEVDRSELFITTKVFNFNQSPGRLEPSVTRSLKRLQTAYVDLLLLHFPVSHKRQAAWPIMEKVYESGRAKSIGVSNYTVRHLQELLATCKIKPAVNQVELHVFLQQPELVDYCRRQGIVIEAYSPLAHGHGHDDPTLAAIAAKHHKTVAQIMLGWLLAQGFVVLPKSTHAERIQQNVDILDFQLDSYDLEQIKGLDRDLRTCWDPTNVV